MPLSNANSLSEPPVISTIAVAGVIAKVSGFTIATVRLPLLKICEVWVLVASCAVLAKAGNVDGELTLSSTT